VAQVPAESGQLHGRCGAGDDEAAALGGHGEAVVTRALVDLAQGDLAGPVGADQPHERVAGRPAAVGDRRRYRDEQRTDERDEHRDRSPPVPP
jgi:hypothetical protein